jgi:tRNA(Ile)-lysidine synthase
MEPVRDALFIRPLCEVTRRESRAHAAARRLPFADDPTNDDLSYHRNRVRSSVLPVLRALNPRADQALAAAAQDLAAEERILEEQAAALCATHWCRVGEVRFCRAARLQEVPLPLRARMWLSTIAAVRGSRRGLTRKHLELAEALLSPGAREAHLPGAHAWRDGAYVCVATRRPARPARVTPVRVEAPGRFQPRPGIEFEFRLLEIREGKVSGDTHAEFDARAVHFPLWIRGPHPSDWMRLEGGGRQKIARQLMNAAVPTSLRQGWLMVSDAEEVLWVPGLRQSATGRPSAESKEVLSIRARGLMFPDPYATQIEGRVSL